MMNFRMAASVPLIILTVALGATVAYLRPSTRQSAAVKGSGHVRKTPQLLGFSLPPPLPDPARPELRAYLEDQIRRADLQRSIFQRRESRYAMDIKNDLSGIRFASNCVFDLNYSLADLGELREKLANLLKTCTPSERSEADEIEKRIHKIAKSIDSYESSTYLLEEWARYYDRLEQLLQEIEPKAEVKISGPNATG